MTAAEKITPYQEIQDYVLEYKKLIVLLERFDFTTKEQLKNDTENKETIAERYWYKRA